MPCFSILCLFLTYLYFTKPLVLWVECLSMVQENGVKSQVESYQRLKKWYMMLPCLALSTIRWGSRVKWGNPGNGVAPSTTPWCSSYWKGSLQVTLNLGHQLYLLYFTDNISSIILALISDHWQYISSQFSLVWFLCLTFLGFFNTKAIVVVKQQ